MTSAPVYILETSRGSRALIFDNLERARADVIRRHKLHGTQFKIIEQTIVEKEIAL
jgi:hypothetical protein